VLISELGPRVTLTEGRALNRLSRDCALYAFCLLLLFILNEDILFAFKSLGDMAPFLLMNTIYSTGLIVTLTLGKKYRLFSIIMVLGILVTVLAMFVVKKMI
jgi:hypothetical protein